MAMEEQSKNVKISISNTTIIRILFTLLLVFAVIKLINIVLILLTSIVIASFVESAVSKLKKYIKNRVFAVFLIYAVVVGSFIGLAYVFVPVFINEMSLLVSSLSKYIPDTSILNTFQPVTISNAKDVAVTLSSDASLSDVIISIQDLVKDLSGGFINIFGSAFGGAINLGLIFIISFYLSIREKGIENFLRIITPASSEEYVIDLWQRTEKKIGLWLQGQMLIGIIMAVLTYLSLTILGLKYSLVLAIITGIFELIPFGIYIAIIPAVLFGYLDGGITFAVVTALIYFILHQFENYLIYPLVIKKVIGISPLVIILSIIIGWELANFWGVVLAIPVSVCLLEFLDDMEKKKILAKNA